jgi:hypothetical protein
MLILLNRKCNFCSIITRFYLIKILILTYLILEMIRRLTYRPIRFSRRTRPNFLKPLRKRGRPSFKELEEREKIDLP